MPVVGGYFVLNDGQEVPRTVLRTRQVLVGRLDDVDKAFALDEGEWDRTREEWLAGHRRYFERA